MCPVWGMKMIELLWKTVLWFLRKLNIEVPYDLAIPLLSICPNKLKASSQAICTFFFIATFFIQPKSGSNPSILQQMSG